MLPTFDMEKDYRIRDGRLAVVWPQVDLLKVTFWARLGFVLWASSLLLRRREEKKEGIMK